MKKKKDQASTQEQAPVAATPVSAQSEWVINCNKCGAALNIKSNGNAYICPVCGTLFRIQTGKRMVREVAKEKKVQLNLTLTERAAELIKANEAKAAPKAAKKKLSARKIKKAMKKLQRAMDAIVSQGLSLSALNDGDSVLVDVAANNSLTVKKQ
ncbi:MAG: hypothetical protein IJ514_04470 [Clostridia bacterium]|nr:hypothetical protein [Clostridia bacterium]